MARTRKKRWSWSTGRHGKNRVRAFEHASGLMMLEYRKNGKRERVSLGHRDRERAMADAERAVARLSAAQALAPVVEAQQPPQELTLQALFDMYGREVTPTKGARSQKHDKAAAQMFVRYFTGDRVVSTLSLRDWERFIQDRRAGRIGPGNGPWKPVRDRAVESDLRFFWLSSTGPRWLETAAAECCWTGTPSRASRRRRRRTRCGSR